MTREELSAGWARLKSIYDRMPELTPAIAREWLRVLEPFSGKDMDAAISLWIVSEKYRPVPVDLARYCYKAQQKRRLMDIETELEANGECPWCGGTGFVWHFLEPEDRDRAIYCQCALSPDRERGAKILAQASADQGWYFDKKNHGFRRRRAWIRDEADDTKPMPAAAQSLLDAAGRQLGMKI